MNGCRFQEKSFSVATSEPRESDLCACGKIINTAVVYRVNGKKLCRDCWDKREIKMVELNIPGLSGVVRPKDGLWDFTDTLNFEKPIHIHSKRQWEAECAKRGLIYKPKNDATKPRKFQPVSLEQKKALIREEMKARGIYDSAKLFKRR